MLKYIFFTYLCMFSVVAENYFYDLQWPAVENAIGYKFQVVDRQNRVLLQEKVTKNSYIWKSKIKQSQIRLRFKAYFLDGKGEYSKYLNVNLQKPYRVKYKIKTLYPKNKRYYKIKSSLKKIKFRFEKLDHIKEYRLLISSSKVKKVEPENALYDIFSKENEIILSLKDGRYKWKVIATYLEGEEVHSDINWLRIKSNSKNIPPQSVDVDKEIKKRKQQFRDDVLDRYFSFDLSYHANSFALKIKDEGRRIDYTKLYISGYEGTEFKLKFFAMKKYMLEMGMSHFSVIDPVEIRQTSRYAYLYLLNNIDLSSYLSLGLGYHAGEIDVEKSGEFKYDQNYHLFGLKFLYFNQISKSYSAQSQIYTTSNSNPNALSFNHEFKQDIRFHSFKNGKASYYFAPELNASFYNISHEDSDLSFSSYGLSLIFGFSF